MLFGSHHKGYALGSGGAPRWRLIGGGRNWCGPAWTRTRYSSGLSPVADDGPVPVAEVAVDKPPVDAVPAEPPGGTVDRAVVRPRVAQPPAAPAGPDAASQRAEAVEARPQDQPVGVAGVVVLQQVPGGPGGGAGSSAGLLQGLPLPDALPGLPQVPQVPERLGALHDDV